MGGCVTHDHKHGDGEGAHGLFTAYSKVRPTGPDPNCCCTGGERRYAPQSSCSSLPRCPDLNLKFCPCWRHHARDPSPLPTEEPIRESGDQLVGGVAVSGSPAHV